MKTVGVYVVVLSALALLQSVTASSISPALIYDNSVDEDAIAKLLDKFDYDENSIDEIQKSKVPPPNPDEFLTAPELIKKYGYPAEIHHVTTQDGYILELHRIPHGINSKKSDEPRPVAFIQHGFLSSSADWLLNRVDKALPYMLAERGYDVWLGNCRGNQYSMNHTTLTPVEKQFWKFSFHEMGVYDLPAAFDYVLLTTKQDDMFFVGHSMGTAMFFICMSTFPDYNSKVRMMVAMGPAVILKHMRSFIRFLAPLSYEEKILLDLFGHGAMLPAYILKYLNQHAPGFCTEEMRYEELCDNLMYAIVGYDSAQANVTELPVILAHTPNSASTMTLVHFLQAVRSGKFQQYDYGFYGNWRRYGQFRPPVYNVSQITTPVLIFHGPNDLLVDTQDVEFFAKSLPSLIDNITVNLTTFNHIDFLFAVDIDKLVNNQVVEYFARYQKLPMKIQDID